MFNFSFFVFCKADNRVVGVAENVKDHKWKTNTYPFLFNNYKLFIPRPTPPPALGE